MRLLKVKQKNHNLVSSPRIPEPRIPGPPFQARVRNTPYARIFAMTPVDAPAPGTPGTAPAPGSPAPGAATRAPLPYRQVHLDFHTSEHITNIGGRFDEAAFQQALKDSRVDSITLFAKCHHSWSYYPTQVGRPHPHLTTDLLGRQIEACRRIGVRCPIYITVGWSSNDAADHPEWCVQKPDGTFLTQNLDLDAADDAARPWVSWVCLWPGGGYGDLIVEQTREICRTFDVDGLFYDICPVRPNYAPAVKREMVDAGVDVSDPVAVQRYALGVWAKFTQRCRDVLFERHPAATIYFNGNSAWNTPEVMLQRQTHFELEHMPSVWGGGYDHFPMRVRALQRYGKPLIAMSGKFHTMWGEFGGYKHPQAMRLEAAGMAMHGCRASFGDQLHPTGAIDSATYRNLAVAYEYAEALEPYIDHALPASDLAILRPPVRDADAADPHASAPDSFGVGQMLLESHREFRVVTREDAWDDLSTLILPGCRLLDDAAGERVKQFIARGGNVLVLAQSLLHIDEGRALFDFGGQWHGPATFKQDYLAAGPLLRERNAELIESPVLCYAAAERVTATDGQVLAAIHEPYFDRTYARYCSHMNTPPRPEPSRYAGVVRKGRVIYLAHPLGRLYHEWGARLHRELFITALDWLDPTPVVQAELPSMARLSLLHQPANQRYLLHVMYAPPAQRGGACVLEDCPPLRDVAATVRVPQTITAAHFGVERQPLKFAQRDAGVQLTLPEVAGHAFVALTYA